MAVKRTPPINVHAARGNTLDYPDLYMDVYVVGEGSYDAQGFAKMFFRSGCSRAETLDTASLVVFCGGSDVTPSIYGQPPLQGTMFNQDRDKEEIGIFYEAWSKGIPMLGVCRGAQFGWVMNGGELFQDVDGHNGSHYCFDMRGGKTLNHVSSVHHQMCAPRTDSAAEIIMTAAKSKERLMFGKSFTKGPGYGVFHDDIEAYYINGFFGVQGHPEYAGYDGFTVWTLKKLEELFLSSDEYEWEGKLLRMKPEAMKKRTACRKVDPDSLTNIQIDTKITVK